MSPERRANLRRLLAPRHVAFIGGTSAALAAEQCAAQGFRGAIWGVNPGRREMAGAATFARVEDLPEAPDATFLAVPRDAIVQTVASLAAIGAGGAVCYTAGFRELGGDGAALERALVAAAGDLALVGPNCLGLLNYLKGVILWPYGHRGTPVERGVAIVSQSGLLCTNLTMSDRSVPFAYLVSIGNQAVLGVEDFIDVLVDDPRVSAIGLYLEGLNDIPAFSEAAARALVAGIPIVTLKAGSSELGARLSVTHTGSLAGADALYDALFARLGVIRVQSPAVLLETLKLLAIAGAPKGRRVAAFTCSGGDSTLLADGGGAQGLTFPKPSSEVAADLKQRLPAIATVANPLDYTTPLWGREQELTAIFAGLLGDEYDAAVLVQDYLRPEFAADNAAYLADTRAFIAAVTAAGIPGAVCSSLAENLPEPARQVMVAGGVAPLQGIDTGLAALSGAARYGEWRDRALAAGAVDGLRVPPWRQPQGEAQVLDEWHGKQRLKAAGIAVPEGRLSDPAGAAEAARRVGYPVAVKLAGNDVTHKSEIGAVRLGLRNEAEVENAVAEIVRSVAARAPRTVPNTFLVERMIQDPVAELLVGVRADPAFGQVLVIASGGVLVELVGDTETLLLPTDRGQVTRALEKLRAWRLLDGYRGGPPADKDAVIDAILGIARFAHENRESLAELDVNPLLALVDGAVAVDVLMRLAGAPPC